MIKEKIIRLGVIKNIILLAILFLANIVKGQIIEIYKPIVVTYKSAILNNEKVNIGIFDRFREDTSKMQYEYLKYDSDKEILYKYNDTLKSFQKMICLQRNNFNIQKNIKLGIFDEFNLQRQDKNVFIAKSPIGGYPSHHRIVNSIEVLSKTKEDLILRVNFQDEFEWKYFGILVLKDYKYSKE
ncbi:hypothetical protein [Chryseobacterium sp. GP-SGM7]|uniref:hypothetical protein n=1 Tax=Chryseobacterium sp. GP-SGM7 TaxID=3411323 RepID=UPI003B92EB26